MGSSQVTTSASAPRFAPTKTAYEKALKNQDVRYERFIGPLSLETTSPACRALTAPGLVEIYPQLRGTKRSTPGDSSGQRATPPPTATAAVQGANAERNRKNKEKKKAAKATKLAGMAAQGAAVATGVRAAGVNYPRMQQQQQQQQQQVKRQKGQGKDGAKGQGKGGKQPLPQGIKKVTSDGSNKPICYGFSQGTCTRGAGCNYAHVCWWCEGSHPGGQQPCNEAPAGAVVGLG